MALENMQLNREVLNAQKQAASAMQREVKTMGGADGVEETIDQVEEGLQDAQEIGEAMSRAVGPQLDEDDDELLAELEALSQDDLDSTLLDVGSTTQATSMQLPDAGFSMPAAPTAQVQMTQEEKELAELEASMAM